MTMEEIKIGDVVRLNSDTEGRCIFTVFNIITDPDGSRRIVGYAIEGKEIVERGAWPIECFTKVERE